jgi:AAA+ ATPase superfamily predicted ATPase
LLKEEFGKEYSSYYSIMSAISKGRRKLNEIEQFTGIRDAGVYLKNLEETYKMIGRRLPVTAVSGKERDGRYYMKDNFLDFWFRLVETRRNLKEIARAEEAFVEIWEQLPEIHWEFILPGRENIGTAKAPLRWMRFLWMIGIIRYTFSR